MLKSVYNKNFTAMRSSNQTVFVLKNISKTSLAETRDVILSCTILQDSCKYG